MLTRARGWRVLRQSSQRGATAAVHNNNNNNNNHNNTNNSSNNDGDDSATVHYKQGDYYILPRKLTVDGKLAVRTYHDRNRTELSDRTYAPQKAWFAPYTRTRDALTRDYARAHYDFYNLETKLIWRAFDLPECIGMLLHDECIKGNAHVYDAAMLDTALHFTRECRYWRCLGITKPFYNAHTLRAHCWEEHGRQVGTLVFSQAMRHAVVDLERALRRRERGLSPDYLWDRWGPVGFIDGARNDYLPRFRHNAYVDPDGVEVRETDVLAFNTHEQLRTRYRDFIEPDTTPYDGVFAAPTHGSLTLADVPDRDVVALYLKLKHGRGNGNGNGDGNDALDDVYVSQSDLRALFYLCVHADVRAQALRLLPGPAQTPQTAQTAQTAQAQLQTTQAQPQTPPHGSSWDDVVALLQPLREACDAKVDAARLLYNTRDDAERVRAFYEEKCGFADFMHTSDKHITAAVLVYLHELRRLCVDTTWGAALARCLTDAQRRDVMGGDSFAVYRAIEDALLERRRRAWAARFAGAANEEATLDYLLENFGRRPQSMRSPGVTGAEFDREQEPIGRQVQRRVMDADRAAKLAHVRQRRGRVASSRQDVFQSLHEKQTQNVSYGVH